MSSGPRASWISSICALALCLGLAGCGGSGEVVSTNNGTPVTPPANTPTVSITAPTPNFESEAGYEVTFAASATDPNPGATIASYTWDFGDGTPISTVPTTADPFGTVRHAFAGTPGQDKTYNVSVKATNSLGLVSATAATITISVPKYAPVTSSISAPQGSLNIAPGEGYTFRAEHDSDSLLPGVTAVSYVWDFGDGTLPLPEVQIATEADGAISHAFATAGTFPVKVAVKDSLGNLGAFCTPVSVVVNASFTNATPVITVTAPVSATTSAYTSKSITLSFTLQDGNGDTLTYTVAWGDGTTATQSVTNTLSGGSVTLQHAYPDSFTATTRQATVTINATDNRGATGQAVQRTRTVNVSYNQLPTATILSPQASGTLPSSIEDGGQGLPTIPAQATDPDVVVIPVGGKLAFNGTGIAPSSGGTLSYLWTFNGGSPSSSSQANPGEVVFAGEANRVLAYRVDFTVRDDMNRSSVNSAKARSKWIIVDGTNSQAFDLSFMYRKRSDSGAADETFKARTEANGFGAKVLIFQDGVTNSYAVADGNGEARVIIPVRSNLPFYVQIPSFQSAPDTNDYLFRIPNRPGVDPSLEATGDFSFKNTSSITGPWDPTLKLVTGAGFADETAAANQRVIMGTWKLPVIGTSPANVRWIDRLAAPLTDPLGATSQWVQVNNMAGTFANIHGYQNFAEWIVSLLAVKTADPATAGTNPTTQDDLRLVLDYPKFTDGIAPATPNADANAPSASWNVTHIAPFRVPRGVTDPYNMDNTGATGTFTANLVPTQVSAPVRNKLDSLVTAAPGSTPMAGGLNGVSISYNPNDRDRIPNQPTVLGYTGIRDTFAYGEYLWSRVWERPLVLNRSNVGWWDMSNVGIANYPFFRFSNPAEWPKLAGIQGGPELTSAFDFTVSSGSTFNPAASPATDTNAAVPSNKGIGRFYWTAYTPWYSPASGSIISRTWLADGTTNQLPTSFPAATASESAVSWGFIPPQDPVVDKRGRDANGAVIPGQETGGYRVSWSNPTRSASGAVVPPDFWVIVLETSEGPRHFMLPSDFPASGNQHVTDPILTDARTFLPSGGSTFQAGDTAGPGYCWFDVPLELRPQAGTSAYLTIFALRSIQTNNPPVGVRSLNRTEWIEGIKTFTAGLLTSFGSGGLDMSYGHKIPLRYPWDIVAANSARVEIKP